MSNNKRVPYIVSSSQVSEKSALGSTITIDTDPIDTLEKRVRVLKSSIWCVFPNVSTDRGNNTIKFTWSGFVHTITLNKGLYGTKDIQESIVEYCENNLLPKELIRMIPDGATNLMTLRIETLANFTMDFEDPQNVLFKDYLGFSGTINTSVLQNYDSVNIPSLNRTNSVFIHCSFANGAFYGGQGGSNIIATCNINVSPGKLMNTEDSHPIESTCNGNIIRRFTIWLTNERNELLDMNNEDFLLVLEIF